jgi:threonine synthase
MVLDHAVRQNLCPSCQAPLLARYDLVAAAKTLSRDVLKERVPSMWRYAEVLPGGAPVTLGEGMTPLIHARHMGAELRLDRLFVKEEGQNPTGSFKARGISAAVTVARTLGVATIALPTAGNAGGAAAAFAAQAGIGCVIAMPKDTPIAIVLECKACGADVRLIDGLISDCGAFIAAEAPKHGWFEVSTLKEPYRIEGKKTMAYELVEQFEGAVPDVILYPTGGGTGLIGMWKAFDEMEQLGWVPAGRRPRFVAVQAAGCAPVVRAFQTGAERTEAWADPRTRAWGLRVPSPLGGFLCLRALQGTGGIAIAVEEVAIERGTAELAARSGIDVCPEGGAAWAALAQLRASGAVRPDDTVVVFNTGAGLKYR